MLLELRCSTLPTPRGASFNAPEALGSCWGSTMLVEDAVDVGRWGRRRSFPAPLVAERGDEGRVVVLLGDGGGAAGGFGSGAEELGPGWCRGGRVRCGWRC